MAPFCIFEETLKKLGQKLEANFADFSTLSPWLESGMRFTRRRRKLCVICVISRDHLDLLLFGGTFLPIQ